MSQAQNRPHLKKIMQEIAGAFGMAGLKDWVKNIEDPLDYEDPNERQAVIERNLDILKQKMALLQHFSNISPESATQYVDNGANFSYQEWQQLEKTKRDIVDYEEAIRLETQNLQIQRAIESATDEESGERAASMPSAAAKKPVKKKMGSYRGWIPS